MKIIYFIGVVQKWHYSAFFIYTRQIKATVILTPIFYYLWRPCDIFLYLCEKMHWTLNWYFFIWLIFIHFNWKFLGSVPMDITVSEPHCHISATKKIHVTFHLLNWLTIENHWEIIFLVSCLNPSISLI